MSKNYPALVSGVVTTVLAVLAGFGLFHLSAAWVGSVEALAAAAAGLWVASRVHEGVIPAAVGLFNAAVVLLVAFKVPHVTAASVSQLDAVITAVLALVSHSLNTPKTRPVAVSVQGEVHKATPRGF